MTGSVLDILIYVFDQYMLAEAPDVPERETLAADLERAGFGRHNVERALDWLADRDASEREADRLVELLQSGHDFGEGVRAFVEKRPAQFAPLPSRVDDSVTPVISERIERELPNGRSGSEIDAA